MSSTLRWYDSLNVSARFEAVSVLPSPATRARDHDDLEARGRLAWCSVAASRRYCSRDAGIMFSSTTTFCASVASRRSKSDPVRGSTGSVAGGGRRARRSLSFWRLGGRRPRRTGARSVRADARGVARTSRSGTARATMTPRLRRSWSSCLRPPGPPLPALLPVVHRLPPARRDVLLHRPDPFATPSVPEKRKPLPLRRKRIEHRRRRLDAACCRGWRDHRRSGRSVGRRFLFARPDGCRRRRNRLCPAAGIGARVSRRTGPCRRPRAARPRVPARPSRSRGRNRGRPRERSGCRPDADRRRIRRAARCPRSR